MNIKTLITLVVAAATPMAALADLPGLPKPAAQANEPSASAPNTDARTGVPNHVPVIMQPMPVRGSLFAQGAAAAAPMASDGAPQAAISMIAVTPPPPKKYHKNDLLTIIIREDSEATTNGKGNSKKTQDFDLALQQFIQLALSSSGVPQVTNVGDPSTLPEIKFKYENNRQSDASQERQDSLSARISATVVDVKPNGTLVVEAVKQILVDKEEQTFTLSGICRVEDIAVDNTLLSTQLANLSLSKQTKGNVHDGTKRSWLNKFIDTWGPF